MGLETLKGCRAWIPNHHWQQHAPQAGSLGRVSSSSLTSSPWSELPQALLGSQGKDLTWGPAPRWHFMASSLVLCQYCEVCQSHLLTDRDGEVELMSSGAESGAGLSGPDTSCIVHGKAGGPQPDDRDLTGICPVVLCNRSVCAVMLPACSHLKPYVWYDCFLPIILFYYGAWSPKYQSYPYSQCKYFRFGEITIFFINLITAMAVGIQRLSSFAI